MLRARAEPRVLLDPIPDPLPHGLGSWSSGPSQAETGCMPACIWPWLLPQRPPPAQGWGGGWLGRACVRARDGEGLLANVSVGLALFFSGQSTWEWPSLMLRIRWLVRDLKRIHWDWSCAPLSPLHPHIGHRQERSWCHPNTACVPSSCRSHPQKGGGPPVFTRSFPQRTSIDPSS